MRAMTMDRRYWYVAGALGVIVLASLAWFLIPRTQKSSETFNGTYRLVLTDYQGHQVHLYEFRRQVLVAYAWASWCPYCGAELEHLSELKKTYGDAVQIVAINRGEPLPVAKAYTDKLTGVDGMLFLIDKDDAFYKSVGGYAMPETLFIDMAGTVKFHQRGPIDIDEVKRHIDEMLGRK